MIKKYLTLVLFVALVGCVAEMREEQMSLAVSLTPEHFRDTATVRDDQLDVIATVTTINGFQAKNGLLKIVGDDNFLRAFIDKKTGKTSFQVYQVIYYGGGWRFYNRANYSTLDGPKSVSVTSISRDVVSCSRYGCSYVEHIAFDIDEKSLRSIAARYQPGQRLAWQFKFLSKSGQDYNDGILPAEVAGFLMRVDQQRALIKRSQPARRK
jgi:hypothetical protein